MDSKTRAEVGKLMCKLFGAHEKSDEHFPYWSGAFCVNCDMAMVPFTDGVVMVSREEYHASKGEAVHRERNAKNFRRNRAEFPFPWWSK